ncbi:hypothetical protein [Saccharopolyspora gregorii]|uniref:Transferase n=1 Tax=Saccharopolyspora gregorii TaxID=33914 RepID=A0ABP6RPN7_9PSEU|nr:hypothetical protein [Saccharopolyspora gregorii]
MLTDLARDPQLTADVDALVGRNMPAFMSWESPGNWRWHRLGELFPEWQLCLLAEDGSLRAAANALPAWWDGTVPGLPGGSDDVLVEVIDNAGRSGHDVVCALSVSAVHRGSGDARILLRELIDRAARRVRRGVLVPLRPTRKCRYPLIPLGDYADWTDRDGRCFDPWLRTHLELGARRLAVAERSLVISQPAERWAELLDLPIPAPGRYLVPGALAPIVVAEDGTGTYAEPNLWLHHEPPASGGSE